ncbi:hypothetical protein CLD_2487 [Clostridium botulinum B1 str. Okra]|uniref:Uncharacterized protein n=1 Tax=Clostridium botulinum (strain Okra / Type B1) TaxID=498213 RepID=B1IG65_CLOBK|nr:hypothetical protein CLD_2487 [Clostridium botulinum B1 str. Okra]
MSNKEIYDFSKDLLYQLELIILNIKNKLINYYKTKAPRL